MHKIWVLFLILALASGVSCAQQGVVDKDEIFLSAYDPIVDQALDAYNKQDLNEFYKNFSKDRLEKGQEAFRAIWVDGYGEEFGNVLSRALDRSFCDLNAVYPMIVYRAKFEKNPYVTIKVIFVKEGDAYKIFYIRFDDLPPGTI